MIMKFKRLIIYCIFALAFTSCESGFDDMMNDSEDYSYTVLFNSLDADIMADSSSKTVAFPATTVDALPSAPVKYGYAFAGWYTSINGTGSQFRKDTRVNGNITLYAKWLQGTAGLSYTLVSGNNYSVSKGTVTTGDVVIPDYVSSNQKVTTIPNNGFADLTSITSVFIPDTIISIGSLSFMRCRSLTSVTIPASVISIVGYPFVHNDALQKITVDTANAYYKDIDGVLFNKSGTVLINFPVAKIASVYIIPDEVTTINDYGFADNTYLTSVEIPDSVNSIGQYAFSNCTALTSIIIPDGVTSLLGYVFVGCTSLTSATIGSGMTSMRQYIFYNTTALKSITMRCMAAPSIDGNVFSPGVTGCTLYRYNSATGFDSGQWVNTTIFSSQVDL